MKKFFKQKTLERYCVERLNKLEEENKLLLAEKKLSKVSCTEKELTIDWLKEEVKLLFDLLEIKVRTLESGREYYSVKGYLPDLNSREGECITKLLDCINYKLESEE